MNRFFRLTAPLALGLAVSACQEAPSAVAPSVELAERRAPIVNGSAETGYPGVGALTVRYGYQYGGSFCTGTLIAPQWVLTAAHCLEDYPANQVRFFLGNDARPTSSGAAPSNGTFHDVERLIIHPQYNSRYLEHDIGLVKLRSPVSGVPTYLMQESNLGPYRGQDVFFIGYGVTSGITERGGGLKRSTYMELDQVYTRTFLSAWGGSGTCFGDSGGPGFLTIGGVPKVVGITSAGTACQGFNCDPCETDSINTRVDAYASWIRQEMGAPPPDCRQDPGICICAEACTSTGSCDNTICQVGSCEETYDCMAECSDAACQQSCLDAASPTGLAQVNDLIECLDSRCGSASDFQTCAQQQCASEISTCFDIGPPPTGTEVCEGVYECMVACGNNEECNTECFYTGTETAQTQLVNMFDCFNTRCGNTTGDAFQTCAYDYCRTEIETCFATESAPCDLVGGDCAAGEACWPTTSGTTACFPTTGRGEGQSCNAATEGLECVDGAACLGDATGGQCLAFCRSDADCQAGACNLQATGIRGIGLCEEGEIPCIDADEDGFCAEDDCNDRAAGVNSAASEICGDGIDNNCSGQAEEGCPGGPLPDPGTDPGGNPGTDPGGNPGAPGTPGTPVDGSGTSSGCQGGAGGTPLGLGLLALFVTALRRRRAEV